MALEINVAALRSAKPRAVATRLRNLTATASTASITANIDSLVAAGTLPVWVHITWLTVAYDGPTIAAALRQTHSTRVRGVAIKLFGKALRSAHRFAPTWEAAGGASGLAALMTELSVLEVKRMCVALGHTGSALHAKEERRGRLTELALLLLGQKTPHDEPAPETARPDPRPFIRLYKDIVPGCADEMVVQWERRDGVDWRPSMKRTLFRVHAARYEAKFLDEIFSPSAKDVNFASGTPLFSKNLPLSEEILTRLLESRGDVRVPDDFMDSFALPLLAYVFRRRRLDDRYRAKIIGLIVDCAKCHETVAEKLTADTDGLFGMTLKLWIRAKDQRQSVQGTLQTLIGILPTRAVRSIRQVGQIIEGVKRDLRYQLLRLIIQNSKRYGLDIDDPSDENIARLKELPADDPWPATMFAKVLDNDSALPLFRRLMKADPSAAFLQADGGLPPATILKQTQSPNNEHGDPEVLHCLLIHSSPNRRHEGSAWIHRAQALVDERRKKAAQAREWQDRAFWAKSALRLCAAAGLLKLYGETLIWARRFNKDALTVRDIYNEDAAEEVQDLLCALPFLPGDDISSTGMSSVKQDIDHATQILIQLLETAVMAAAEPSFQSWDWNKALGLPGAIINRRFKRVTEFQSKFEVSDYDAADFIWKPTIDMVLEVEAITQRPDFKSTSFSNSVWRYLQVSRILTRIADTAPPAVLAQLAAFWLDRMKQRLGPGGKSQHIKEIVSIVQLLGRSDQVSLACPFVRDFILDDDEDNSAWHRSLLNVGFLSALPARAAKELLHAMADAIAEKMIEQNTQPPTTGPDGSPVPAPPTVKVTTVKMLAQVLRDALFISPTSACDILINLLAQARHVDIQVAIVESLLSTLVASTSSAQLRKQILESLERYVVPMAAQLSEYRSMTEADWSQAASAGILPEVSESPCLPAIMDDLVDRAEDASLAEEHRAPLARLVMRAAEQSIENNSRWVALFLKTYGFDLGPGFQLPAAPVQPKLLSDLFGLAAYMPRSLFEMLRGFILVNLNPPANISHVTRAVKDNQNLVDSNAGRHWLSLYNNLRAPTSVLGGFANPRTAFLELGGSACASALHNDAQLCESKLSDGVTIGMVQGFVLEIAEAFVAAGDAVALEDLTWHLLRSYRGQSEIWNRWKTNTLPVLRQIVAKIESIRTERWERDPDRKPTVLPNSFRLRTRMLAYPYSTNNAKLPSPAEEVDAFVAEVSELIDGLAGRGIPYHEDWAYLKTQLMSTLGKPDFVGVALGLGTLEGGVGVAGRRRPGEYLRVELAGELLLGADGVHVQPMAASMARDVVRSWRAAEVEEFRIVAVRVETKLTKRNKAGEKSWFSNAETSG